MNFRSHSLVDLLKMRRAVDEELKARHEQEPEKTESTLHQIARQWGYAIDSVLFGLNQPVPRYRHPMDGRITWDGNGEAPGWVRDWLKQGRSLEELKPGRTGH